MTKVENLVLKERLNFYDGSTENWVDIFFYLSCIILTFWILFLEIKHAEGFW